MVTHRAKGYQPDLFEPLHDVIDGGEGGAAADTHVLAAVVIHERGPWGSSSGFDQESQAFWLYYDTLGMAEVEVANATEQGLEGPDSSERRGPGAG